MSSRTTFGRRGVSAAPQTPAIRQRQPDPDLRPDPHPRPIGATESIGFLWLLFSFEGRLSRLPYWLGNIGVFVACQVIAATGGAVIGKLRAGMTADPLASGILILLVGLISLGAAVVMWWAALAITAKRWHDRDRPWGFVFLGLIPIVGWLWQFIECGCLEGTLGPNRYGPSPRGVASVNYVDDYAETFG